MKGKYQVLSIQFDSCNGRRCRLVWFSSKEKGVDRNNATSAKMTSFKKVLETVYIHIGPRREMCVVPAQRLNTATKGPHSLILVCTYQIILCFAVFFFV